MRLIFALLLTLVLFDRPVAGQDNPPVSSDRFFVLDLRSATAGEYLFVVTVKADGSISYRRPTVVVVGVGDGNGGGGGGKEPNPPQPPTLTGLAAQVVDWVKLVEYSSARADAAKLAASYESIARRIESEELKNASVIVMEQLKSNLAAVGEENHPKWMPFTQKLADHLTAEVVAGRLTNAKQHVPIWKAIATGLRAAAK